MTDLIVTSDSVCSVDGNAFQCAVGRSGFSADKVEGDGATPIGVWPMRRILFRPDRLLNTPHSGLPVAALTPTDGWCDDPNHAAYNRPVTLPFDASHEIMWRDDGLYDVVVVLGHNDAPPVPGHGSAIFFHCASPDFKPTEGCVALARADVLQVLTDCTPDSRVIVQPE